MPYSIAIWQHPPLTYMVGQQRLAVIEVLRHLCLENNERIAELFPLRISIQFKPITSLNDIL